MHENEISGIILDSAMKIHQTLGPGLLEQVSVLVICQLVPTLCAMHYPHLSRIGLACQLVPTLCVGMPSCTLCVLWARPGASRAGASDRRRTQTTQSVADGIPTQSVGTSWLADRRLVGHVERGNELVTFA